MSPDYRRAAKLARSGNAREAFDEILAPTRHDLHRHANQIGTELPWWQGQSFGNVGEQLVTNPANVMGHGLLKKAIEGGPPVHRAGWSGNLVVPAKQLLDTCKNVLKLRPIWIAGDTKNGDHLYANDTTMIRLDFYSRGRQAQVSAVTTCPEMVHHAGQLFDRCLKPDDPDKGMVFTLARTMHGYSIRHLGLAGSPLERGNYSPKVVEAYDHIVEDLNAESPCGRLVVLAGEPGTGKTYLVRSFLSAVPKAAFVIIPPNLVEELGSPDILPSLTAAKSEMNGPIVMIIEDADSCLAPRKDAGNKTGNMNAISSLLNLGDGILGSVLDIRIIATTNAEKVELDPATQRPGRLCKYASVDSLPPETAAQCLYRLTDRKVAFDKNATLAEVYQQARTMGWKPPSRTAATEQTPLRTEILC
jgi:energy-coupling factor transporter ATP-binding protein EcfA2